MILYSNFASRLRIIMLTFVVKNIIAFKVTDYICGKKLLHLNLLKFSHLEELF